MQSQTIADHDEAGVHVREHGHPERGQPSQGQGKEGNIGGA
jgi:hypothetical protein